MAGLGRRLARLEQQLVSRAELPALTDEERAARLNALLRLLGPGGTLAWFVERGASAGLVAKLRTWLERGA